MTTAIAILLFPLALLTGFFALEAAVGLRWQERRASGRRTGEQSAVIVIPAHDEAAIIGRTLPALSEAAERHAQILVVADNCTDATAAVARKCGGDVIERCDPVHRGKGFALDFARLHLSERPPSVVVVIDADCVMDAASLEALIAGVAESGLPVQAVNLLRPNRRAPPLVQLSTFAFLLKNLIRQRGLQTLAGRVHLTGTGMALPWPLFASCPLSTDSIVEDIALGLHFSAIGSPPQLITGASVWSDASDERGTFVQRRRWEGGFLDLAARVAPGVLWQSFRRFDLRGLVAALDLCVPPLALLMLVNGFAIMVAGALTLVSGAHLWPLVVHCMLLAIAAVVILLAWWREGRAFISLSVLLRLPLYVAWKAPLYLGLAGRGTPREWLRPGR